MRKEYTLNFEKDTSKTARTTAKKKHCQHKSDKIIRTEDQENKKAPEVEHLIEDNWTLDQVGEKKEGGGNLIEE